VDRPARILLASTNRSKLAELAELLAPLGLELLSPAEVGGLPEVDEDQPSFALNARKKALSAAAASGAWALADDSGLEVDALGGEPGVRSARFAGPGADDARNNALLLQRLAGVPEPRRGARFVCALALARPAAAGEPARVELEVEGEVRGRILEQPRGAGGFGYDPLFLLSEEGAPHRGRSFGELERAQKAAVSHRGRALARLARELGARLRTPLA